MFLFGEFLAGLILREQKYKENGGKQNKNVGERRLTMQMGELHTFALDICARLRHRNVAIAFYDCENG